VARLRIEVCPGSLDDTKSSIFSGWPGERRAKTGLKKERIEMRLREKTTATLLIAIFMISMFAVGVQASQFLTMEGGSLSVTSVSGSYPEETVLDDVAFDAQSGLVTIEGAISDLYVASGAWPHVAYLEIGVRPEATKEETNAGVYMIVFGSSKAGILAIHLQDYGGQRPPCPPWPVYIPVEKAERVDYKITLIPSGEFGGTAYLEMWDMDGKHYEAPSQEYGYSTKAMADSNTLDEDFSEARLFYSLMADGDGKPDITYSATIGDITTNILLPIHATVDIKPETLNFKGNGKYITAYISLPEGYSVEDIDVATVMLKHEKFTLGAVWGDVQDGVFMVKFDRTEMVEYLGDPDVPLGEGDKFYDVTLMVTGKLLDGTPFVGSDMIQVLKR